MRRVVKSFSLNGEEAKFQVCYAKPRGGEHGDVVLFTMGNPTRENGTPVEVGDKFPFEGYFVTINRMLISKEVDISLYKENLIDIIFGDGEKFRGLAKLSSTGGSSATDKYRMYEDVYLIVDILREDE